MKDRSWSYQPDLTGTGLDITFFMTILETIAIDKQNTRPAGMNFLLL